MRSQIDKQRSIRKHRLIYHANTELVFNRLFENFIWIICLALPVLPLFNNNNQITTTGLFLISIFWVFLLTGLYFINHLTMINGTNQTINRIKIIEILKLRYPEFTLNDSGKNVIKCKKKAGLFGWGKQITVMFDQDRIFINSTTLGRYDIKSPFHSIFNAIAMRHIKKDFMSA
ncbi:hypothetical protein [Pedobacter sp. N23S346]|uniref:hypothetical protein n=1 Tax=Pedobacter sp. N23S346 TaxID=3402750 RepID=UPI003AD6C3EA